MSTCGNHIRSIVVFSSIFLMVAPYALQQSTSTILATWWLGAQGIKPALSTLPVVATIMGAITKLPIIRVTDLYGRPAAFILCLTLYITGLVMFATSSNFPTYVMAQAFLAAASSGIQVLQQIFWTDTSAFVHGVVLNFLPSIPNLLPPWLALPLTTFILRRYNWQLVFKIWAIVMPLVFLPLMIILIWFPIGEKRIDPTPQSSSKYRWTCFKLDLIGLILLGMGLAFLLIPFTLTSKDSKWWTDSRIIGFMVSGGIILLVFGYWEFVTARNPYPLMMKNLSSHRSYFGGCAIGFLLNMVYALSVTTFQMPYLLVAQDQSASTAACLVQIYSFASSFTTIGIAFLFKDEKTSKPLIVLGSCVFHTGLGLLIKYRSSNASLMHLVIGQIILGIGSGTILVPVQNSVQCSVHPRYAMIAVFTYLSLSDVGTAIGSMIAAAVWNRSVPQDLQALLPDDLKDQALAIFNDFGFAKTFQSGSEARFAIDLAMQRTMTRLALLATYSASPLVLLSLYMMTGDLGRPKEKVLKAAGTTDWEMQTLDDTTIEQHHAVQSGEH